MNRVKRRKVLSADIKWDFLFYFQIYSLTRFIFWRLRSAAWMAVCPWRLENSPERGVPCSVLSHEWRLGVKALVRLTGNGLQGFTASDSTEWHHHVSTLLLTDICTYLIKRLKIFYFDWLREMKLLGKSYWFSWNVQEWKCISWSEYPVTDVNTWMYRRVLTKNMLTYCCYDYTCLWFTVSSSNASLMESRGLSGGPSVMSSQRRLADDTAARRRDSSVQHPDVGALS